MRGTGNTQKVRPKNDAGWIECPSLSPTGPAGHSASGNLGPGDFQGFKSRPEVRPLEVPMAPRTEDTPTKKPPAEPPIKD